MANQINSDEKPFSSKQKNQFVCYTCGKEGKKTTWELAKADAIAHKNGNPDHHVDIIVYQTNTSRNNFV